MANLYLLPAFDPLAATPPGNGRITPGTVARRRRRAVAASRAASAVAPKNHRFPPISPSAQPHRRSITNSPDRIGTTHDAPAVPLVLVLVAVAEVRELAAEREPVLLGWKHVEAGGGRAGEHVLADADEHATVRGAERGPCGTAGRGTARPPRAGRRACRPVRDVAVEPGLAVAEDGAAGVAGRGVARPCRASSRSRAVTSTAA